MSVPNREVTPSASMQFFARYHISDIASVRAGLVESGLADHFWIENPGKDEHGRVQENSFTLYTDLIRPDSAELLKQYESIARGVRPGLIINLKV
jgi:hypothetical protein